MTSDYNLGILYIPILSRGCCYIYNNDHFGIAMMPLKIIETIHIEIDFIMDITDCVGTSVAYK
jgi:hypothetical protein